MYCYRKVTDDLYWVGASDHRLAQFENIHPLAHGVSYNSYLLLDEKTVLFDTADWSVGRQFMENAEAVLAGRPLDYLVVNHMEPDHAATIGLVMAKWPQVKILTTAKSVVFLQQFGYPAAAAAAEAVKEGDSRCFGRHTVKFLMAPMVHWPEVMVSFDTANGVLFSADAFGSFNALDGRLFADEVDYDRDWLDETRRYYANIVGKFGMQVSLLIKKVAALDVRMICPLHGLVWRKDIPYIVEKHALWAGYQPEEKGVVIVYGSMYGNTENAAQILAARLAERGVTVRVYDVSETHKSYLISDIFRFSHLVLAGVTYNLGIFPPLHDLLADMQALCMQNRTVGIIENGSWACRSGALLREQLAGMKDMNVLEPSVKLASSLQESDLTQMNALADALDASVRE